MDLALNRVAKVQMFLQTCDEKGVCKGGLAKQLVKIISNAIFMVRCLPAIRLTAV